MFGPMKILRRLLWVVTVALVLSGLTVHLLQTSPVRDFALTRIQVYLRQNPGLVLQVGHFDYDLLSSKFEFKEVGLTDLPSPAQEASLTAKHVVVTIPAWRLALGSFDRRADLDRWSGRKLD